MLLHSVAWPAPGFYLRSLALLVGLNKVARNAQICPQNRVLLNVASMVALTHEPGIDCVAGTSGLEVSAKLMRIDGIEQALNAHGGSGVNLWFSVG
jgi:hypothetical protein